MTTGLLPEFQERLGDFDVWERVDLVEGVRADVQEIMLASDMGKSVDNPGCLVETSITKRVGAGSSGTPLAGSLDEREVCLVDGVENVLPPSHEVTPDTDVIADIGQAFSPEL